MEMKGFGWLQTDMVLTPNDLGSKEVRWNLKGKSGIYRFYNDEGVLLYIGHSTGIYDRLKSHLLWGDGSIFKDDVSKILLTFKFDNVEANVKQIVDDVEHLMIRKLKPIYNKKYYN